MLRFGIHADLSHAIHSVAFLHRYQSLEYHPSQLLSPATTLHICRPFVPYLPLSPRCLSGEICFYDCFSGISERGRSHLRLDLKVCESCTVHTSSSPSSHACSVSNSSIPDPDPFHSIQSSHEACLGIERRILVLVIGSR